MPSPQLTPPKYLSQEDGLTQECKTLLSSLPRDKGWVANHIFQYEGFWHTARQLQGVLTCQQHFQANPDDLLLVTLPKSGTTWLKAITFAIINRSRYSFSDHPLLTVNPHELVPFLELKLFLENQIPDLTSMASPRLFSTHLPYVSLPESAKQLGCKMVFLCRDPRDVFISAWHFTNKLRPQAIGTLSLEEAFERFCRGVINYGPAWDQILEYWKQSLERPEKVIFLKFEEMKAQPSVQLKRLAEFFGFPISEKEEKEGVVEEILKLCSFDHLSNLDVNKTGKMPSGEEHSAFFRRGEVGDWVNHFTPGMIEKYDKITEEMFHASGLHF
ncbi:cytosolic sulfotransferase 12-like [Macadamia integrifolia]|uniref:cytosolic sulfotransferase 12-like n=1 Tax=Macadamia integrifolia TaxID=60698 RepID=UPI001C52CF6D|nr:cytosolic sulfotransferase 12-like [Macadamia integrifolia]